MNCSDRAGCKRLQIIVRQFAIKIIHVSFLTAFCEGKYDDYEEELVGGQYHEMFEMIEMMLVRIFKATFALPSWLFFIGSAVI